MHAIICHNLLAHNAPSPCPDFGPSSMDRTLLWGCCEWWVCVWDQAGPLSGAKSPLCQHGASGQLQCRLSYAVAAQSSIFTMLSLHTDWHSRGGLKNSPFAGPAVQGPSDRHCWWVLLWSLSLAGEPANPRWQGPSGWAHWRCIPYLEGIHYLIYDVKQWNITVGLGNPGFYNRYDFCPFSAYPLCRIRSNSSLVLLKSCFASLTSFTLTAWLVFIC